MKYDDAEIEDMILAHEGGIFTNHPADRGGPTKWGVTLPVLSKAWNRICTPGDIKNLTRSQAADVYRVLFIAPFNALEVGVLRANVIDMGVNAGVSRSVRLLQQAVGADVDGVLGSQTVRLSSTRDWNYVFMGVRIAFYERIIEHDLSQLVWRNGWRNRALSFDLSRPRIFRITGSVAPLFGHQGKALVA